MRRERVVVETLCDGCQEVIPTNGMQLEAGPLDFCIDCASIGVCLGCGSLSDFPWKSPVMVHGNCMGCWRAAMALPRGKCGATAPVWLGLCPIGFPKGRHGCRNLPGHSGGHECLCGATWT